MLFVKIFLLCLIFYSNLAENLFFDKLNKLLNHCAKNIESVTDGTLVGINWAKGHLMSVENKSPEILQLVEKCNQLENIEFPQISRELGEFQFVYKIIAGALIIFFFCFSVANIMNSTMIQQKFPLKYESLPKPAISFQSIEAYLILVNSNWNLPNGKQSDECLMEIFNGCKISNMCQTIEDPWTKSLGYSLTHKLLFHLMNHITCHADNFPAIKTKICANVFAETQYLVDKTLFIPELKDLLMEQMFLCTHVGYGEFLNNNWIRQIISWQLDSGCFSYDDKTCSSHMNGLGAALLALFGRILM